ncbi:TPA: hypothetical protein ACHP08_003113 [Providencia stuartii]
MHEIISIVAGSVTIQATLGVIWTALSFSCGAYFGHKLNLSRDIRKEFNAVADPMRLELSKSFIKLKRNEYSIAIINDDHISIISDMLSPRKSRALLRIYNNFRREISALSNSSEFDPVTETMFHGDTTKAAKATEKLLRELKRK